MRCTHGDESDWTVRMRRGNTDRGLSYSARHRGDQDGIRARLVGDNSPCRPQTPASSMQGLRIALSRSPRSGRNHGCRYDDLILHVAARTESKAGSAEDLCGSAIDADFLVMGDEGVGDARFLRVKVLRRTNYTPRSQLAIHGR
jgi:hypothetical protein